MSQTSYDTAMSFLASQLAYGVVAGTSSDRGRNSLPRRLCDPRVAWLRVGDRQFRFAAGRTDGGHGSLLEIAPQLGLGVLRQPDWQLALRGFVLRGNYKLAYRKRRRNRRPDSPGCAEEDGSLRGPGRERLGRGACKSNSLQLDGHDRRGHGAGFALDLG